MEAPLLDLVGRETETARLREVLEELEKGARAVVVRGGPGIGKTALWRWGLDAAAQGGARVLVTRCVEVEMPLALSAIVDLLELPFGEVAGRLPVPQRRALAVALGLEEPPEQPAEPLTLSRAVLEVLRSLSTSAPVVVAIDDAQWLDAGSQRVLAFAVRRLKEAPVAVLATLRAEAGHANPLALEDALGPSGFTEIELGALTAGALHQLVRTRLGVRLPRPLLARVHRTSGGNPMFALELARALSDHADGAGAPLPVPDSLHELVRARVASLPTELMPLARLVAILERPTLAQLGRAFVSEGHARRLVDIGFAHAVLDVDTDGVVRFAHPLLASAVYAEVAPIQRRELQYHAAEIAEDEEERARHLALAATTPDEAVASVLDAAATRAAARGTPEAAAELARHALRLTAVEAADRARRALAYATYLVAANRPGPRGASVPRQTARELDDLLASEIAGDDRARVLILRSLLDFENAACVERLREALTHARDAVVRARTLTMLAWTLGIWGWDLEAAAQEAERGVAAAASAEEALPLVFALTARGTIDNQRGLPGALAHLERALTLQGDTGSAYADPAVALGRALMTRGDFDGARALFETSRERARRAGEDAVLMWMHRFFGELELRCGRWEAAQRDIEAGLSEATDHWRVNLLCLRALLAARRGEAAQAETDAADAHAYGDTNGDPSLIVGAAWAWGSLALGQAAPGRAYEHLARGQAILDAAGIGEPGLLPVAFELAEAAAAVGRLDHAERLAEWLGERAAALDHPWARAAAARCHGIVTLGAGDPAGAITLLERARAGFAAIGAPYELAHTDRTLGAAHARLGERRLAAEALRDAHRIFGELGAPLWQKRTDDEFRRAYPRPRRDRDLTSTEERVAALVASGQTNREVAAQLFITIKTVEAHLTRIYRKTGVRSRTELAGRYAGAGRADRG
ncbi:MAG: AAA family ATPase [Candidatus Dormibacteraeota bacterium]|nr:AAA family ATPase [Candidatus Dormibacteraeota bacterium]